jgi:hypothetical protein
MSSWIIDPCEQGAEVCAWSGMNTLGTIIKEITFGAWPNGYENKNLFDMNHRVIQTANLKLSMKVVGPSGPALNRLARGKTFSTFFRDDP